MHRILLLAVWLCCTALSLTAETFPTVHVSEPGTLEDLVYELDVYSLDGLKVTGKLNSADLATLRSGSGLFAKIPTLDISEITLEYDDGCYGTGPDLPPDNGTGRAAFYLCDEETCEYKMDTAALGTMIMTWVYRSRSLAGLFCYVDSYDKVILPPMEQLGGNMFGFSSVKEVVLPANLKTIGMRCFRNSKAITTLNLPATVETIEDRAFDWSSIENITGTAGIKHIGETAFFCSKLKSFDFSSVESLGEYSFYDCGLSGKLDLSKIKCEEIPQKAFESTDITALVTGPYTKTIGIRAFANTSLRAASLSPSLERVCNEAFDNTVYENNRTAENGVVYIAKSAYLLDLPSSATTLTIKEGTKYVNSIWRGKCPQLTTVNLPSTVKRIGETTEYIYRSAPGLFAGCTSLTSINLPEGLEVIGNLTFSGCTSLTELNLPNSLLEIGPGALSGCTGLKELTLPENAAVAYNILDDCSGLMKLNINCNITDNIGKLPNVIHISVGKSVTHLGSIKAPALRKVEFEERDGQALTLDNSFNGCTKLTSADLPEGITRIGSSAFDACEKLAMTSIPSSVKYIGRYAFRGTQIGPDITISEQCDTIESEAFYGCASLASIQLPRNISHLGSGCFDGTSITSMHIYKEMSGKKWTPFRSSNFYNKLSNLTFEEGIKSIDLEFNYCPVRNLYVPDGTEQFNLKLYGMRTLETLSLPASCLKVGARIESDLLESIEWRIPENHEFSGNPDDNYIGSGFLIRSTFHWQSSNGVIQIPEGIGHIKDFAFYDFGGASIYFPSTLKSLDEYAIKLVNPDNYYVVFTSPEPPTLGHSCISNVNYIFVPRSLLNIYKETWKNLANKIYPLPQLESLSFNHDQMALSLHSSTYGIFLNEIYEGYGNGKIEWSVDNDGIVAVENIDAIFNITPLKAGATTLRARCDGFEATCRIYVMEHFPSFSPYEIMVEVGETAEVSLNLTDYMTDAKVSFYPADGSENAMEIEKISDSKCRIKGITEGEYGICAEMWPIVSTASVFITNNSGIGNVNAESMPQSVYNTQGILIFEDATPEDIESLPAGLYIIGGKKQVVH
ncbi:MAG: leucine-rich repeat domain-containing protein [Muribaculaceae bacterium]|nr:leucine-rich repeat domain-containing protein [Muribaculaceae bacterium]